MEEVWLHKGHYKLRDSCRDQTEEISMYLFFKHVKWDINLDKHSATIFCYFLLMDMSCKNKGERIINLHLSNAV